MNEAHPLLMETVGKATKSNGNAAGASGSERQKVNSVYSVNSTWDELLIPGRKSSTPPNIPSNLLPVWLGDYTEALSKSTQTPSGLAVMMAFSVVATCVQKRFEVVPFDDYREPLSLWTATAMASGSRKTAVVNALTAPLIAWETERSKALKDEIHDRETKIAINQKVIERLHVDASKAKDSIERKMIADEINKIKKETPEPLLPPRLWTGDVTPERLQGLMVEHGERMSLLSDEGGIFEVMAGLYSGGKANIDVFLQGHAGQPVRVDRGTRAATLKRPAISFGLAVQPAVLSDLGNGGKKHFRGIGALARFMYCVPVSNVGHRNFKDRHPVPETLKWAYRAGIFDLLNIPVMRNDGGEETPRTLHLSPGALEAWETFAQFVESKQGEGREFEPIQDWTGKLPGAALRIAGLCHVSEYGQSNIKISESTMGKALDLCELLITHAQFAFEMMGGDKTIDDAKLVLKWIEEKGELAFLRSDCHKAHHGRFERVGRLIEALDVLVGWNVISEEEKLQPGVKGGRPPILHHVNPAVLEGNRDGMA